jgi:hypothetical protein
MGRLNFTSRKTRIGRILGISTEGLAPVTNAGVDERAGAPDMVAEVIVMTRETRIEWNTGFS